MIQRGELRLHDKIIFNDAASIEYQENDEAFVHKIDGEEVFRISSENNNNNNNNTSENDVLSRMNVWRLQMAHLNNVNLAIDNASGNSININSQTNSDCYLFRTIYLV